MLAILDWILENIDPQEYYKLTFPEWSGDHNINIECPFKDKHEKGTDNTPSFSVNIRGAGGCYCFGCDTKIGSVVHAEKLLGKLKTDEEAAISIYSKYIHPIVQGELDYPLTKEARNALKAELLLTDGTIDKFNLGWDKRSKRIAIPIRNEFGLILNVRFYRLPSMRQSKQYPKLLNHVLRDSQGEIIESYGKDAAMFPKMELSSLCRSKHKPEFVFWFTGERDTLLAWDLGLPSFCYTTGENVCKPEWVDEIISLGIPIVLVGDNDDAGLKGLRKRKELLDKAKIECSTFVFDIDGIKDFSDYILAGNKVEQFLGLLQRKEETKLPETEDGETAYISGIKNPSKMEDAGEFSVSVIGRTPELLNKPIRTKAIVSGKIDRTYSIPVKFKVNDDIYTLPISREMVLLIRQDDVEIVKLVRMWMGNPKAKVEILEYITVTEVEIIPMIERGKDSQYVNQKCFLFVPTIECNKPYLMRVVPTSDMATQETIGLILEVEPVSNILDAYEFSDSSIALLQNEFNPREKVSILDNLKSLSSLIGERFTGISNRTDLHLVGLLTYLCPLQFEFPHEGLQRGWMNTLVLGDTETGKSQVSRFFTQLFHCGVFINAESCSYMGLVGGMVKSSSGMPILRWGKIPLYNRQLVIVEELSGMDTVAIAGMSEIRSAGVARYDKGGLTGETSAKTRLLFLSNVRGKGKHLGDYNTGVQAALELIGQNEDLARFDLILTTTDDEIDHSEINRNRGGDVEKPFSEEELSAFRELVMFAWSLKPEQIEFSEEAYQICLERTMSLSAKYHPSIPMFKAASGRFKLARISIAIACTQFAWDVIKKKLVITKNHVNAAADLMEYLFNKSSFGYARYSKIQFDLQTVKEEPEAIKKMDDIVGGRRDNFLSFIAHADSFTKFELAEAMGIIPMHADRLISQFFLSNMLKKADTRGSWTISKAGRLWCDRKLTR